MFAGAQLTGVDRHVAVAMVVTPGNRMFLVLLVVTQLETGKLLLIAQPQNQIELARGKPAALGFAADFSKLGVVTHLQIQTWSMWNSFN